MEKEKIKKTDITLVNLVFPTYVQGRIYRYVPVGILYLASSLEKSGYHAEILDLQQTPALGRTPQGLLEFLKKAESSIMGIGVMARDLPQLMIALEQLKKERPDTTIILGGPGPTGTARKLMDKFPFIDYVIKGEGEKSLPVLIKLLKEDKNRDEKAYASIQGLTWRKNGETASNPPAERLENLDELAFPAYHLIDPAGYNYIYLPGARGCSHFCTFCDQPVLWQGREIKRSIPGLFSEIEYIKQTLKAGWGLAFSDNEFCADPERFKLFINTMKEKKIYFPFSMDRRIDAVDRGSLRTASLMGCRLVLYGIESGSDRVLKEIKKEFTADRIKPGLLLSSEFIENSIASFMFSYPFETLEDFLLTINLIYPLFYTETPNYITFQLHYLAPLPRTAILAKYGDMLIRRNNPNLLTSRDNLTSYNYIGDQKRKKTMVTPLISTGRQEEANAVTDLVYENPEIFPFFYFYDSPELDLKEKIIESMQRALPASIKNIFFKYGKNMIFLGTDFVTVTGSMDDGRVPAILFKVTGENLENIDGTVELWGKIRKKILITLDHRELSGDKSTGSAVFDLLSRAKSGKIDFHFISHIPKDLFSFTDYLRMTETFKMPQNPNEAGDLVFVDERGFARGRNGKKGRMIGEYGGKEQIIEDLGVFRD